jgi:8-oxo-dGTP pyrophosphatase MutT (NUDIX family)
LLKDYIKQLRERIGHMKIVMPGVRGLVIDEDGRLLLQKRADFSTWGLPAGVVDPGESALEALRREVKEETGITVLRAEPFGLYSDPKYSVTYPNGDEVQTFTMAFLVREWTGSVAADGVEAVDAGFFPLDDLPTPLYPIHVESIGDYRSYDGTFIVK